MRVRIILAIAALLAGCGHMAPKGERSNEITTVKPAADSDVQMLAKLRPGIQKRIETLAPADLEHLPWLLGDVNAWQRRIPDAKQPAEPDSRLSLLGVPVSNPTDAQLVVSMIGQRIEHVLRSNPTSAVRRVLTQTGYKLPELTYMYFPLRTVNSAGEGPIVYPAPPSERTISLPVSD
jgi:hypothetical protein